MVKNHSVRISNETDLILDNIKLKARQKGKKVYKRDIIARALKHYLSCGAKERIF